MTTVDETEIDAALEKLATNAAFIINSQEIKIIESHGAAGQRMLKEIYRSVYDPNEEFTDYFSLVFITSLFLTDSTCYSIFKELNRETKIPLIDAIWSIASDDLNAYLVASKLAGNPKPFFSEHDPLNTSAFYADLLSSESELFSDLGSEDFKEAYVIFCIKSESYTITTTLYILRLAFGESAVIEMLKRCIDSNYFPSDTKLVSLMYGYEKFKEYPLEWMVTVVDDFVKIAQILTPQDVHSWNLGK